MTYHGRIENGKVVLNEPVELPEGAMVRVELANEDNDLAELRKDLLRFAGVAEGLPSDMARNHDNHLHGFSSK